MNDLRKFPLGPLALAAAATVFAFGISGCNGCNSTPAPITNSADANGAQDPAEANLADPNGTTAVLGQNASYTPQQNGQSYAPDQTYQQGQAAPQQQQAAPVQQSYSAGDDSYNQVSAPDQSEGDQSAVYSEQAPPPLPEYDQPPAPDPNDLWTPGYWAWGTGGYYWVPGAWVAAPYYGALWTPSYWGYYGNRYYYHHGYWGPHVGFYGGVDYGFGYIGVGYFGGYWHGHDFWYNRSVNRIPEGGGWGGRVYERPVVYNNVHYGMQPSIRISFNGGRGGIDARPRPFEVAAMHEQHVGALAPQIQARQAAASNRGQFYAENHGRPAEVVANHAYGSPSTIHEAPASVHPGRPGMNGVPAAPGRPVAGGPETRGGPIGPNNAARPGVENRPGGVENRPGEPAGPNNAGRPGGAENRPGTPVGPNNAGRPGVENHPGAPTNNMRQPMENGRPATAGNPPNGGARPEVNHPQPQMQQHVAPQIQRSAPVQRSEPAPQMHATPAPQVHEAPAARPAPEQHAAPAPRAAPAPAPRAAPAPAPHAAAPAPHAAPAGGGGHEEGGRH